MLNLWMQKKTLNKLVINLTFYIVIKRFLFFDSFTFYFFLFIIKENQLKVVNINNIETSPHKTLITIGLVGMYTTFISYQLPKHV